MTGEFDEAQERDIEAAMHMARRERLRRVRRVVLTVLLSLALCVILAAACVALFFKVGTVTVSGSGIYDDWRIREASGIVTGSNLYKIDKAAVAERIIMSLPYIRGVSIRRSLPSTVIITVTEDEPLYYCEVGGEYFLLSATLRVLERTDDPEGLRTRFPSIIRLVTLDISRAVVGEEVAFYDSDYFDYALEMLAVFAGCPLADKLTTINFNDKYDIYLVYDGRFRIEIGSVDSLALKMTMASEVLASMSDSYQGLLNVENDPAYVILGSKYVTG